MIANSAIPGASTVRPSSASLSSSRGWGLMSPPRPSSRSGSARATMPVCRRPFRHTDASARWRGGWTIPPVGGAVDVRRAGRGQALQALESFRRQVVDSFGCFLHWAPTRTGPRRRVHAQSGLERSSTSDQQNERRGAHPGSSIDRCEIDSRAAVHQPARQASRIQSSRAHLATERH